MKMINLETDVFIGDRTVEIGDISYGISLDKAEAYNLAIYLIDKLEDEVIDNG